VTEPSHRVRVATADDLAVLASVALAPKQHPSRVLGVGRPSGEGLPYRVQVALAEIAGATSGGVLPRASGPVGSFGDRGRGRGARLMVLYLNPWLLAGIAISGGILYAGIQALQSV